MPTMTALPTAEVREEARDLAVQAAERVARQLLALGLLDHPRRAALVDEINAGRLLPRLEVRLSDPGPLLTFWADAADGDSAPLFLFCAGTDAPDDGEGMEGRATPCSGTGRLN